MTISTASERTHRSRPARPVAVALSAQTARWVPPRSANAALAVLLVLVALVTGAFTALPAHADTVEDSFTAKLNVARTSRGLPRLTPRASLVAVARAQAQRMATQNVLFHNPNLTTDITNWRWVGENVGYGPDAATVHSAFMHSAGHRANILDHDYTEIGIGSVTVDGRVWVAEVFRRPMVVIAASKRTTSSAGSASTHNSAGSASTASTRNSAGAASTRNSASAASAASTASTRNSAGSASTASTRNSASAAATADAAALPRATAGHSARSVHGTRAALRYRHLLRPGSSGTAVRRVQARLHVTRTGRYDAATVAAVSRFQRSLGWHGYGRVGRGTWARLFPAA